MHLCALCSLSPFPHDAPRLNLVHHFEHVHAVARVVEQIVHVHVLDVQRVDPHAEHALLATVPRVVDFQGREIQGLFALLEHQAVAGVEQLRHQRNVQLLVSVADILVLDKHVRAEGLAVGDHARCANHRVRVADERAFGRVQAIQNDAVDLRVLKEEGVKN